MGKKNTVLFIPAGGLTSSGRLPEFVKLRLDAAIEVFNSGKKKESFIFIVSGRESPYKKPILDKNGFPLIEAQIMAQYLLNKGVEMGLIRIEKLSLDTLGSVYFSKILIINYLFVKKIIVFTSDFHLERTKLCFKWVFNLKPFTKKYTINFISVPSNLFLNIIKARQKKEKKTIKIVNTLMKKITAEKQFNSWLFSEHAGYTHGLKIFNIDKNSQKTY